MKLVFDIEATGAQRNKAHAYDYRNKMCNLGIKNIETNETFIWKIEYDETPYGQSLQEIQSLINGASLLIGVNAKFDLHWLSRYGISLGSRTRVFDCQNAFYILTAQQNKYPSLDGMAEYYGLEKKLDVVKTEYWDMGLDTDEVPYEILSEYLAQDLEVTRQVYEALQQEITQQSFEMQQLIKMTNLDLVVLQDIEKNGLLLNLEKSVKKGNELVEEIGGIDNYLIKLSGHDWFNPNSGDHLSAFLYGGIIKRVVKEDYEFVYKDGRKAIKQRNTEKPFIFKGLFKPLEGSELAKEGFYATNEPTLTTLLEKARGEFKSILEIILHRAKLEKRRGTYYHGYPKRILEMGWDDNILHSSLNQCVATNGRLSSTKPNIQNIEDQVKEVFKSRFSIKKGGSN